MGGIHSDSDTQENELPGQILSILAYGFLMGSAMLVGFQAHIALAISGASFILGMFAYGLMAMTEERSFEALQKRGRYRIQRRLYLLAERYRCLDDVNTTLMFISPSLSIHAFLLVCVLGLRPLGVSEMLALTLGVFLLGVAALTRMVKYGLNAGGLSSG